MLTVVKEIGVEYFADKLVISNYSIWEKLTVRKLNLSRRTVQKAYKEMQKTNFNGDIIDFICFDSLSVFINEFITAYRMFGSVEKTKNYIESYLYIHPLVTIPACRLLLRNGNYLSYVFKSCEIEVEDKLFILAKDILTKKINTLLAESNYNIRIESLS